MTEEEYQRVLPVIEMAQRLHFKLQRKLVDKGVEKIDVAIAGLYATFHLASLVTGNRVAGIEWMRTALDSIEKRALERPGLFT